MAVYEYRGLTPAGKRVTGIVDADNPRTARSKLRHSGIYPVELVETQQAAMAADSRPSGPAVLRRAARAPGLLDWLGERITVAELAVITRQLGTLLAAGLPLLEALSALSEQVEKRALRRTIAQVRERVKEGSALADALSRHPRVFSTVYIQMIRVGEASGTLDRVLIHLANFLERHARIQSRVRSALAYPVLMLVVSLLILAFLMSFVVPRVLSAFSEMQQTLPLATRILLVLNQLINHYWWAGLLALATGGVLLHRYLRTPAGRVWFDDWKLRLPVFGGIHRRIALARFADTLGVLLRAGVPLLQAFDIVKAVVSNQVLERALQSARENIKEGESIAEPLRRSGVFPPLLTRMIAVGEASGELEGMLEKVAETYNNEVEIALGTLMSLLTPLMVLGMGLVVLFIVMAILLPILEMSQLVR